jgi:hypothetical protein
MLDALPEYAGALTFRAASRLRKSTGLHSDAVGIKTQLQNETRRRSAPQGIR